MRPNLCDFAIVENADKVSILDSTETVRNSKCDPIADLGRLIQCILNDLLTFSIQRTGRLVEQQNLGVSDESSCNRNALPLSAR